jgi:hypothetical protein
MLGLGFGVLRNIYEEQDNARARVWGLYFMVWFMWSWVRGLRIYDQGFRTFKLKAIRFMFLGLCFQILGFKIYDKNLKFVSKFFMF